MTRRANSAFGGQVRSVGERILLTLWVGGLWLVGYVVAPVLFNTLDDRALAGALAGQMFQIINGIGLVCGLVLVAATVGQQGWRNWRVVVLGVMVMLSAVVLFILQPMMDELRVAGASAGGDFGRLHGIASGIHLVLSLLGLGLVAAGPAPRD